MYGQWSDLKRLQSIGTAVYSPLQRMKNSGTSLLSSELSHVLPVFTVTHTNEIRTLNAIHSTKINVSTVKAQLLLKKVSQGWMNGEGQNDMSMVMH